MELVLACQFVLGDPILVHGSILLLQLYLGEHPPVSLLGKEMAQQLRKPPSAMAFLTLQVLLSKNKTFPNTPKTSHCLLWVEATRVCSLHPQLAQLPVGTPCGCPLFCSPDDGAIYQVPYLQRCLHRLAQIHVLCISLE